MTIILCAASILLSLASTAQQLNFAVFGVDEGLPQSTVFEIFQDKDDFLWIGTDGGGISRYDGFRFKTYNKANGLKGNVVRKITQDKKGVLWIATDQGLHFKINEQIKSFDLIPGNSSLYITSILIDHQDNLWISSAGKGVYHLQRNDTSFNITHFNSSNGLSGDYVFDVAEDKNGKIWIANFGSGLDVYSPSTKKFERHQNENPLLNEIISLFFLNNNQLLLGTKQVGAYIVNPDSPANYEHITGTGATQVWSFAADSKNNAWITANDKGLICSEEKNSLTVQNGLPSGKIVKIICDRENNIWMGTLNAGLIKYSGKRFSHISALEIPGLSQVSAIRKHTSTYWIGTASGLHEIVYINQKVIPKQHFSAPSHLPSSEITSLSFNKKGLWIGTRNGLSLYNGTTFKSYNEKDELIHNNVNCVLALEDEVWIGTAGGLSLLNKENKFVNISESNGLANNEVQCLHQDKKGNIWIGTLGGLIRNNGKELYTFNEEDGLTEKKINCLAEDKKGNIYIGTAGSGIFKYTEGMKIPIMPLKGANLRSENIYALTFYNDTILLATTNQGIYKIFFSNKLQARHSKFFSKGDGLSTLENSINAVYSDKDEVWIGTSKGITLYHPSNDKINTVKPEIKIDEFKINGVLISDTGSLNLNHDQNNLFIAFSSLSLTNPSSNKYFVKLIGFDTSWNAVIIDKNQTDYFAKAEYKKLSPGSYTLQLKSANNSGVESSVYSLPFLIRQPFYKTPLFIIVAVLLFGGLIILFFKLREKNLIREKEKLEKIVTERTAEVVANKIEIENQKDLLEHQKQEITDSINYSKRIQNAILPEKEILFNNFPESFLIYQPKDIVSGDFYFISEKETNLFFIAAADCTGHGVPGAFMSMIGSKELSEAVNTYNSPSEILSTLNKGIRKTLKQNDVELGVKDGMDIAFISARKENNSGNIHIRFAGANRPLWILRKDAIQIEEIKATKTAIGGYTQDDQVFEEHNVILEKGDTAYMFSDGYADQFGGTSGKKMMTKQFKENLLTNKHLSMKMQGDFLLDYFNSWKGTVNEQVDDVLVIGIRA